MCTCVSWQSANILVCSAVTNMRVDNKSCFNKTCNILGGCILARPVWCIGSVESYIFHGSLAIDFSLGVDSQACSENSSFAVLQYPKAL